MKAIKVIVLFTFFVVVGHLANAKPSESELLDLLHSGDFPKVLSAFDKLPKEYPNDIEAIAAIRGILHTNASMTFTEQEVGPQRTIYSHPVSHIDVAREAARALGNYHIVATDEDISDIFNQLIKSHDLNATMDGLKALRDMTAPQAVPLLIPLLQDENDHVLRDTIRTLAVLGDDSTVKYIEPFTRHQRLDVIADAKAAIKELKKKSK